MEIMIVEDEPMVAAILAALIEAGGAHEVVGIAHDFDTAAYLASAAGAEVAFIDIMLANQSSGYAVAADLNAQGIVCIFSTATPPPFQMPEMAAGCIQKPYHLDDVERMLELAQERLNATRH